jgi:hypothetical protein
MPRQATLTLAAWLLVLTILEPLTAFGQRLPIGDPAAPPGPVPPRQEVLPLPEPLPPVPTLWSEWATPDTFAYGAGAALGLVGFYFYLSPIAAAAGATSWRSWLGTRVMASATAAGGGVLTTYAYDLWTDRPVDTVFFKSRIGAVAGVGVGSALLSGLGFPPATALVRFSPAWAANRAFLVGSGIVGEGLAYLWLRPSQPNPPP